MLNNIVLVGRTCADAEQRYLPNGTMVARFTLAVERDRKGVDGQKAVDFIRCSAFSKTAEYIVEWIHKGRLVSVVGSLHINNLTQPDGTKRSYTEVTVERVQPLEYEKRDNSQAQQEPEQAYSVADDSADDVPFD